MMIEDELVEMGFSVEFASTQKQAIALASERCPDLIIADARLDEGSGVDAVTYICRDNAIPVIFMTGDSGLVNVELGDAVLLEKPFTRNELRIAIGSAGPILNLPG